MKYLKYVVAGSLILSSFAMGRDLTLIEKKAIRMNPNTSQLVVSQMDNFLAVANAYKTLGVKSYGIDAKQRLLAQIPDLQKLVGPENAVEEYAISEYQKELNSLADRIGHSKFTKIEDQYRDFLAAVQDLEHTNSRIKDRIQKRLR